MLCIVSVGKVHVLELVQSSVQFISLKLTSSVHSPKYNVLNLVHGSKNEVVHSSFVSFFQYAVAGYYFSKLLPQNLILTIHDNNICIIFHLGL